MCAHVCVFSLSPKLISYFLSTVTFVAIAASLSVQVREGYNCHLICHARDLKDGRLSALQRVIIINHNNSNNINSNNNNNNL